MPKPFQNVILLIEPHRFAYDISLAAVKMGLNRFCIDEEAGFESTGVYYLEYLWGEHERFDEVRGTEHLSKHLLCFFHFA